MGLTYNELSDIGRLRKVRLCGPYSMFIKLLDLWKSKYTPVEVRGRMLSRLLILIRSLEKLSTSSKCTLSIDTR